MNAPIKVTSPISDIDVNLIPHTQKTEVLSKELAEKILAYPTVRVERALRKNHLLKMCRDMERHTFLYMSVQIALATLKGKTYRLNGQHTCKAVSLTPESWGNTVQVVTWGVQSEAELTHLHSLYNTGLVRGVNERVTIRVAHTGAAKDLSVRTMNLVNRGVSFWRTPNVRVQDDIMLAQIITEPGTAKVYNTVGEFLQDKARQRDHLRVQPVIAAMLAMFEKATDEASEFWSIVGEGGPVYPEDPRRKLRDMLVLLRSRSTDKRREAKRTSEEIYRICLNLWNRWRRGDLEVGSVRIPKSRPEIV
jgi:hypothetical protein